MDQTIGQTVAGVGIGLGMLQTLVLFILKDMRERIMRLESREMKVK